MTDSDLDDEAPALARDDEEDLDGCEAGVSAAELTADEDLPVAEGGVD